MYMNVIGILAVQRRGAGLPALGVGFGARPRGGRAAAPGAAGAGLSCWLARAFPDSWPAGAPGPRGPLSAARARSCLRGTAGAGLGAHACVAGSRHDSRHSARISPHLRRLAVVVVAVRAARLCGSWIT